MPPVVIAAIAYIAGAITIYQLVFVAVVYAYSTIKASAAREKAKDAFNASLRDRLVMVATVDGVRSRVYGRARNVDGVLFKATRGDKNQFFTLVIAVAGHEVDGIEDVYFGDVPVTLDGDGYVLTSPWSGAEISAKNELMLLSPAGAGSITLSNTPIAGSIVITGTDPITHDESVTGPSSVVGNTVSVTGFISGSATVSYQYQTNASAATSKARVRKYLGAPGQDLSTVLHPLFPDIIIAGQHRFEGTACLIVDLEYSQDAFPTGVIPITAVVRGAKLLDPRTGITAWTENPALCARDWALYSQGGGASTDEIVLASFVTAANACDVTHAFTSLNADGASVTTTRPLYTCNTVARPDADPSDTLTAIVESMAGAWAWTGGMLRVRAGAYSAPVATLTESWCGGQGDINITANVPRTELVNVMTPTIADAANNWSVGPAPRIAADAYISLDGGEYPRELTLDAVSDQDHAQHVCGVLLRDSRQALTLSIPCNLRAYPIEVFDTVAVTLPRFGFDAKNFLTMGWEFSQMGGVVLTFKETDASVFDPDATFTRSDPAPNSDLPDPFTVAQIVLHEPQSGTAQLLRQDDGTIVSRILVTWDEIEDQAVLDGGVIEIAYGFPGVPQQSWQVVSVPGSNTQAYLSGVQDGAVYLIRSRARNKLVAGQWAVQKSHLVVGKTAAPANVAGLALAVVPGALRGSRTPSAEADYAYTIYRYGTTFAGGATVPGTSDTNGFVWPWPPVGAVTIWAADVDTTGNVGTPVSAIVSVSWTALNPTSSTLSIELNVADFAGTLNYNECWIHGYDGSGAAADVDGTIIINGVPTTVPHGLLFGSQGPHASYIALDQSLSLFVIGSAVPYAAVRRYQGQWQYDNNSAWTNFTPTASVWLVGTVEAGAPDTGAPGSPPGIVAASMWSSATTPTAMVATADQAYATAVAAQSTANAAATDASNALTALTNIASDSILSPSEKPAVQQDYAVIVAEQAGIDAKATAYGITTEKAAYDSAVATLVAYLGGLTGWNTIPGGDVTIVGTTFRTRFYDVYTTRQALLDAIAAAAGLVASWVGVTGRPKSFVVRSTGNSATSYPSGWANGIFNAETGAVLANAGRSYGVAHFNTAGALLSFATYDVFGTPGQANAMAAALNALPAGDIVVMQSADEPQSLRLDGGLDAAMCRCGASLGVYGSPNFQFRSAYILVGIVGCGIGNGAEVYAGAISSDPDAWCQLSFQLLNGVLSVSGLTSGANSLTDFGYTGALDATANQIYYSATDPALAGPVADGSLWSNGLLSYKRVGGTWIADVGDGGIGTNHLVDETATQVDIIGSAGGTIGSGITVCNTSYPGLGEYELTFTAEITITSFTSPGKVIAQFVNSITGGVVYGNNVPQYDVSALGQTLTINQPLTIVRTGAGSWGAAINVYRASGSWDGTLSLCSLRVTWIKK